MATTLHRDSWDQYVAIVEKEATDMRAEIERLTTDNEYLKADAEHLTVANADLRAKVERLTAENERLRKIEWAAQTVLKTFRDSEAAGYHTKDRQYAIDLLGKFVVQQLSVNPEEGK